MPILKSVVQVILFCIIDPLAQHANVLLGQPRYKEYGY
jgi:hypothetical protein